MSKRRIGGPFGRRSIALVAFVVAIAAAGLVWAHWTTSVSVDAQVSTGSVGIHWTAVSTNDDGHMDGWDVDDDGSDGEYSAWGPGSSLDPSDFGPGDHRYEKDVAGCWAGGDDGHIWVDIQNAYPSYHCTVNAALVNTSTIPLKVRPADMRLVKGERDCDWWYTFNENAGDSPFADRVMDLYISGDDDGPFVDNDNDGVFGSGDWRMLWYQPEDGPGFNFIDEVGDETYDGDETILWWGCNFYESAGLDVRVDGNYFEWGYYNEHGEFVAEITGNMPGGDEFHCGNQIEPYDQYWNGGFNFHVEQEAQQNATYRWEMYQEFVNYNEFGEYDCGIPVGDGQVADFTKGMGARWKAINHPNEFQRYVGVGNLGTGDRVETRFDWGTAGGVLEDAWYHLQMEYDPGSDTLTGWINDEPALTYNAVSANAGCPVADMNTLYVQVFGRDPAAPVVELHDVQINGSPLMGGPFVGPATSDWDAATTHVVGYPFADGFHMSGNLYLHGAFDGSNESSKVEFLLGCTPPAP